VRHAPDNLVKEEPSAGGAGEGVVVERAVEATASATIYRMSHYNEIRE
jgi:hypothetical protein